MDNYSTVDLEAFVARFYKNLDVLITPFGYTASFVTLAQGASATTTVAIAANADFVMLAIRHRAQIAAAQNVSTKTTPFVKILVIDSGTNEQYTNGAVDLENYSTNGQYDHALPYPRIISGRSVLTVQVTNFAPTAETYATLDVFFEGVLVRVKG